MAEHSYQAFPDFPEGKLAKVRAAVVNARVLAEVAEELAIGEVLLLGRGEETSGGRTKASILSDALEAVIGALYLDAGWEPTRALRARACSGTASPAAAAEPDDFDDKSRLQEMTVRQGLGVPRYAVVGSGPDHDRKYEAEVYVGGECHGVGVGTSKKDAEQDAARVAWQELHAMPELPEVETLRLDLGKEVTGRKIKTVAVGNGRSVRRHAERQAVPDPARGPEHQLGGPAGQVPPARPRQRDILVVHLGMSGQLLRVKSPKEPKPKHTHVVITFTQGGELRYVDPRTFGEMFVSTPPGKDEPAPPPVSPGSPATVC